MQAIARELKGFVNEVGYLCRLDKDLFDLKYYSSEREVDFCGHATEYFSPIVPPIRSWIPLIRNNNTA